MKTVVKKDGRRQPFDRNKLVYSILKAFKSVEEMDDYAEDKANNIADFIEKNEKEEITADELGNLVEKGLMSCKKKNVAKSYILYRDERDRIRGNTTDKTIDEIVSGTSTYWTSENSNKNAMVASTQRDYMAGAVSEDITRRKLLPRDVIAAHDAGELHFHDIDYFCQHTANCCLVNLEDMLQNGTVINQTKIETPHSFGTACTIATQIMAVVASGQYGGQSISLAHLAPFVDASRQKIIKELEKELNLVNAALDKEKFDTIVKERLKKEISDGVQTMQYQINTLNTSNGQTPFVTLFMYLGETHNQQEKEDLALIIEEVLKQRIQGVKNEVGVWITPAFPKLIYVLEEVNIHEDSPYWYLTELAAKCSAKRLVPDYISEKVMKELKQGYCYPVMGCRSALTVYHDENGEPKFYGRFNQGVVTVNLADIGLSADHDLDKFWQLFEERTELCHKALRCRHERLLGTPSDISPIHWQFGGLARLDKGEKIDKLLYNGYSTLSLGYAALWECVMALIGKKLTEPEGEELGLKIMQALNDKCTQWKEAEHIDYSLYGTPLESTTYKFAKALKNKFGVIPGITDKDYVTNSYHVHVTEPISAFDKLALEAKFQRLSPGGAISYVETPNMQNNIPAVLEIIKFIYNNIMYAELNTKSDYCQVCGWDGEIKVVHDDEKNKWIWKCPNCGNTDQKRMNVARRTCGYIGANYWNQGKR